MAILARITDATEKSLNPIFNQKGSFSCTVKIDSAAALVVEKWKHCIIVQRPDGTAAWSGPITGIVDSAVAGTTQLSAQGWQSELDYRWIRSITELQDAVAYVTPAPEADNPSFATNVTSWTASSSVITRSTSVYDTSPASGRWDSNGSSGALSLNEYVKETFTGTFFAGVTYYVTFRISSVWSTTQVYFSARLGYEGSTGTDDTADTVDFNPPNGGWQTYSVSWTPKSTYYSGVTLRLTHKGSGSGARGAYYYIDTVALTDSYHATAPTMDNPSFQTNTTNWTATTSTITRDTTIFDSGVASGRWDNTGASDNLNSGDYITGTSTGTFLQGVTYTLKFKIKMAGYNTRDLKILTLTFGYGADLATSTKSTGGSWEELSISWTPTSSVSSASLKITATSGGHYAFLDTFSITQTGGKPADTTFYEVNDGDIAEALVRLANLQTDSTGTTRATHLTPNGTATTTRTRTYQVGQNIGAAIRELSDIENGFDIDVDPTSREIAFIPNTSFTDQTDVAYGYNTFPRNLDDVIVNDDGTTKANSINVQGAFIIGNTDSPTDIADTGVLLEDWISAADIKDESIVGAYANEEIVFRADGQMTIAAKPSLGAPMPYIDYDWGDKVYISANKGRMQLDRQAARVFSGRISWNSQNEPVLDELGLTP